MLSQQGSAVSQGEIVRPTCSTQETQSSLPAAREFVILYSNICLKHYSKGPKRLPGNYV
jgi:hypothetical protein